MTSSASDPEVFHPHRTSKEDRKRIEKRFKDENDPLEIVIVRDMWLTGFDAPPVHTLYIDKPMQGHNLMQAIARTNRVWADKPGGLVVDYIGTVSYTHLDVYKRQQWHLGKLIQYLNTMELL